MNVNRGAIGLFSIFLGIAVFFQISHIFVPFPGIIPDELTYQRQAFYPVDGDVGLGNFLFSSIYGFTTECGPVWYTCVKSLNVILEVIVAVLCGLIVYMFTNRHYFSWLAASLVFIAPVNAYSGYFMPDTAQAIFMTLTVFLVMLFRGRRFMLATLPWIPATLAMFIKPHAFIFFAIMLAIVLIYLVLNRLRREALDEFGASVAIGLALGLMSRVLLGGLLYGAAGLNPLAGYAANPLDPANLVSFGGSSGEGLSAILPLMPRVAAAFFNNALPGLLVIFGLLIIGLLISRGSLREFLGDERVRFALAFISSGIVLTASFAAVLELRQAENVVFRLMTRYWEFTIPVFAAIVISIAVTKRESISSRGFPYLLFSGFLGVGVALLLMPRSQTQSDSSLLWAGYFELVMLFGMTIAIVLTLNKIGERMSSAVFSIGLLPLAIFAVIFHASLFDFASQDKSGTAAGGRLISILESYPDDATRVQFVGERSSAVTASFLAKLAVTPRVEPSIYSRVDYDELDGFPRWVFATKEVFITGKDPVHTELLGDMILYEYGYPARIPAYDFNRYEIDHSGELLTTYWGAWMENESLDFTVPEDFDGDTLVLFLLGNEEFDSVFATVNYGDKDVTGVLLPDQKLTEVSLTKPNGDSWAGERVSVSGFLSTGSVDRSQKQTIIGISGFSVYYSN